MLFLFRLGLLLLLPLHLPSQEVASRYEKYRVDCAPREQYAKIQTNAGVSIEYDGSTRLNDYIV